MLNSETLYRLSADCVVIIHLGFVLFVVLGGLLAARWRRGIWIHVAAVAWGATIELTGWICPLTPLENWLRQMSGGPGYQSDFIARYLIPILYPRDLTRSVQITLGIFVILLNVTIYLWLLKFRRRRTRS